MARAAVVAGSYTIAVLAGAIIVHSVNSLAPKRGSAGFALPLIPLLRILVALGLVAVWAALGYCAVAMHVAERWAAPPRPPVPPCDASLLDPLLYVATVVAALLLVGAATAATGAVVACCTPPPGKRGSGGASGPAGAPLPGARAHMAAAESPAAAATPRGRPLRRWQEDDGEGGAEEEQEEREPLTGVRAAE